MIDFKSKKIIITGATGGIGNALVEKFNDLNGNILATGTNEEKLNSLKKKFPNIKILKFDISDHSQIEEFIESASNKLDGLDILVNNAGITKDNLSLRMKDEEWNKVIHLNLSSTFPNVFFEKENIDLNFFIDMANVWEVDYNSSLDSSKIRSSTGVALNWFSGIGPLSFSYAIPLSEADTDITESFRFQIGTSF